MGTSPQKKRRHRLERWQVLLAAVVAAIASIIVALINLLPGGPAGVSVGITGLLEQSYPPPPGQLYVWTGTVSGQPPGAEVFVVDKSASPWLVSSPALISGNGWTVSWPITAPPASAEWVAMVWISEEACPPGECPTRPSASGISGQVPSGQKVLATATYQPRARPAHPQTP